jgi:hypothetical protein
METLSLVMATICRSRFNSTEKMERYSSKFHTIDDCYNEHSSLNERPAAKAGFVKALIPGPEDPGSLRQKA